MFSKYKGRFGYLKKQPIRLGLMALAVIISSVGIFLIGYINKGDSKNILSLVAVLGMLPAAKLIVSFIIQMRAEKYTCPKDLYEKSEEILKDSEIVHGYDFYLTSYKENFPAPMVSIADGQILVLLTSSKNLNKECKEHIEKYLSTNSINGYKPAIFDKDSKYFDRLSVVCKNEVNEQDYVVMALIKNLSL